MAGNFVKKIKTDLISSEFVLTFESNNLLFNKNVTFKHFKVPKKGWGELIKEMKSCDNFVHFSLVNFWYYGLVTN